MSRFVGELLIETEGGRFVTAANSRITNLAELIAAAEAEHEGGENSRKNVPDGGRALGQAAAKARWDAYYATHPDKLRAKEEREAKKLAKAGKKTATK